MKSNILAIIEIGPEEDDEEDDDIIKLQSLFEHISRFFPKVHNLPKLDLKLHRYPGRMGLQLPSIEL